MSEIENLRIYLRSTGNAHEKIEKLVADIEASLGFEAEQAAQSLMTLLVDPRISAEEVEPLSPSLLSQTNRRQRRHLRKTR